MKGGCAAAIYSLIALLKRKEEINGELFLSCVFGEEAPFSLGADTLLREHDLRDYDLILLTEPSPLLTVNDYCVTHKRMHRNPKFPVVIVGAEGRIAIEIEFFGKSSHASHPSQGVNALHDAAKVISKLAEFDLFSNIKMGRGHYVVLSIEGGDQSFTVPGYCKILINRQLTLGETSKTIMTEIKKIIKSLNLKSKVNIAKRYSPSSDVEYRPYLFEEEEFIELFMKRLPSISNKGRCKMTSSSVGDNNLFAVRTKVPTLVFGPGGGNIHAPNEFVNKNEVIETTNYLLDFFMEVF
jgi:succinyl-diaminopimelate desuccinylase